MRLPVTGSSSRRPVRRTGRGPKARTRTGSATLRRTRWRDGALPAGRRWKLIWSADIADVRFHGTTGERPIDRFTRIEAASLQPLEGRPPYHQVRELRKVHAEATIEIDTNQYSVPWRLIGTSVTVEISAGMVRVFQ